MQVGVNVKCMHTNFGGHGLSGFGDIVTFKIGKNFPIGLWTIIVHGDQKIESNRIDSKIHASRG